MFDAGRQAIPDNEVNVAADLYAALNDFYARNAPHFDDRPLIVAGESYAGCVFLVHDKTLFCDWLLPKTEWSRSQSLIPQSKTTCQ